MNSNTSTRNPVIDAALDAMNAHDAEALAALFVDGGSVQDVDETFEGAAAIREWFAETPAIRLEPTTEVTSNSGLQHVLEAKAHGDYPQSPLPFRYDFELDGDRIRTLRISLL